MNIQDAQPSTLREMIKQGKLTGHTSGMAKGYVQANVVILPSKYAYDFYYSVLEIPKHVHSWTYLKKEINHLQNTV